MDGQTTELGDGEQGVDPRPEVLNRLSVSIPPMKRLFGDVEVDRGLERGWVRAFASVKGLQYEDAHQRLTTVAQKTGFEAPDVAPDYLLTHTQVLSRNRVREKNAQKRLIRERFRG